MTFRCRGVQVTLSFWFFCGASLLLLADRSGTAGLFLLAIAIHEGGHLAYMLSARLPLGEVRLTPLGLNLALRPGCCPTTVIMEAQAADCLYRSAEAADGKIRFAQGDLATIMAGLACGEPNTISFDILKNHSSFFVSCPDWVAAKGMRMLGAPLKGDPQVVSGESGAVGMGLIATLMTDPDLRELKEAIGLDRGSKVLMFSTEGDTDPENYRRVVWGGEGPKK